MWLNGKIDKILMLHMLTVLQIPVVLLISQLQKEVDGRPRLLRFSELVNLFHEFCHVVCERFCRIMTSYDL